MSNCAACGFSVQRCRAFGIGRKCCPDCRCSLKRPGSPARQLGLPWPQRTLELEPLLRGELLAAMAAVVFRPEVAAATFEQNAESWEQSRSGPPATLLDDGAALGVLAFLWPQTGDPLVHYPLGGTGPRVEHAPGIVCNLCQWKSGSDGFPLPAYGREPRRFCPGCQRLITRDRWVTYGSQREHCARCTASGIFDAVLSLMPHPPARRGKTARKVKQKDVRRAP